HDAVQRTPSLSQQQAHRKRAFKDITNQKSTSSTQRPEQSLVDHDEEEDELARDFDAAEPDGAKNPSQASGGKSQHDKSPKKRGRGRPPKRTATQRDRSTENHIDDFEAEEDVDVISELDDTEKAMPKKRGRPPKKSRGALTGANGEKPDNRSEDEAIDANDVEHKDPVRPEKKGRGRPPKVVIPVQREQAEQSPLTDRPSEQSPHPPPSEPREKETGLEEPLSNPIETNTSTKQAPTPSPEKSGVGKSTPPPNRASPTSHSPIKSNSKVPYRVGLSKRQKIPSLLRTMRPPKRTI
ncbi:hypothetical protein KC336_g21245, partial [Hortaea werneckii]